MKFTERKKIIRSKLQKEDQSNRSLHIVQIKVTEMTYIWVVCKLEMVQIEKKNFKKRSKIPWNTKAGAELYNRSPNSRSVSHTGKCESENINSNFW